MKKIRFSVDKITGDIALLVPDDDGKPITVSATEHELRENDVADVTISDEKIVKIEILKSEAEARLASNASRLRSLFSRNKK